jgi:Flp pilus assembly protein TadB
MYDAIFQNRDMAVVGRLVSFRLDEYEVGCEILDIKSEPKKEIMFRFLGYLALLVSAIATALTLELMLLLVGVVIYVVLGMMRDSNQKQALAKRKAEISMELPRFADLLYAALIIGQPIELAINIVSSRLPGILSKELRKSMSIAAMGAKSWEGALDALARKYEVDELSDFVMQIVIATKQGVPVAESVGRKSREMKHNKVLKARENATKMNSAILVPVVVFKLAPIIGLMIAPLLAQLQGFAMFF